MTERNSLFRQGSGLGRQAGVSGGLIQKPVGEARRVLERLSERDWLEAKGEEKGRNYHFAPGIYEPIGQREPTTTT